MSLQPPPSSMTSNMLLQEFREICMKIGADRTNRDLQRRADDLQVEIDKRMAW